MATLFVVGCSSSSNDECDKAAVPDSSFHDRAFRLMESGGSIDECIELQKKAVEELRRGEYAETAVDILSQMGYLYSRGGEYLNGLLFLQEAADSLNIRTESGILGDDEIEDAIRLYGNTSNLYTRMGLYDEALALNDKALALAVGKYRSYQSDLWRMRSVPYDNLSKLDSAFSWAHKAIYAAAALPDSMKCKDCLTRAENHLAILFIEHPDYMPDSVSAAAKVLERNLPVSRTVITDSLLLGRASALLGNPSKGISMMRAITPSMQKRGEEEFAYALEMLSESLVENALASSDYEIYKESRRLTDAKLAKLKANALLGADFRYRTSQVISEKQSLEKELALTHQRNLLLCIIFVLAGLVIVAAVLMSIKRKNRLLRERRAEIDNLIGERIRLNREIEKMSMGILHQKQTEENTETPNNDDFDASEIFSMVLLTQKDETRFRQLFSNLNPGFIENIRSRYPEISPNAELVLMLIRLRKSNEEIALTLGIKRDSVTKARYRLRSLFGLSKETDLNEFITQL